MTDEEKLREEYKRAEARYETAKCHADDAQRDADDIYRRMEAIGEAIQAIEDERDRARDRARSVTERERWMEARPQPGTLREIAVWLLREPPPPATRRLRALVQDGLAVSNGHAALHVRGETTAPADGEDYDAVSMERVLRLDPASKYEVRSVDGLCGQVRVALGAATVDGGLLDAYVVAPAIASGDASVQVWHLGPTDPVMFKTETWTAVLMPMRLEKP